MNETNPLSANQLNRQLDADFSLQAAGIGIWELDPITKLVNWDDRCRELFGLTNENQLPGEQVVKRIHPDDVSQVKAAVRWAMNLQSGGAYDVTCRTIGAGYGQLRWVRFMGKSYFTEAGVAYRFAGVAQDVTKDTQVPDKTDLLQAVFDGTSAGISVLTSVRNDQGSIVDFTYQLANLVSKQFSHPLELAGQLYSAIHPAYRQMGIFDDFVRVVETGQPVERDRHYAGEGFDNWYATVTVRHGDGVVFSFRDVNAERIARQQAEDSENRFRTLADSIDQLAWIADADGWIYWFNERWYEYTGTTLEQMQGWGWQLVHHPDHQDRVVNFVKEAWGRAQPFELTFPLRDKTGNYRWFLTRVYPIQDEQGQVIQWVGTNTDIDEQKTMAEQLEQLVVERTQQLQASVQDLERSNRNLEQFAYIASHDLQEPLRKVQSFGDLLKNQYADTLGEGVEYLNRMQSAASRMSIFINDLLTYSRISTRQEATVPVQLGNVLDMVLNNLEVVIEETSAQITVGSLPTIQGDASQLGQLFQNLLSNALKFRRDGVTPAIRVGCQRVAAADLPQSVRPVGTAELYYCIEVSDNGIGFDDKYANRIFGVFQRLHNRSQYPGTGIGLAICEKVAVNHGGAIMAISQPQQGATFRVYLPTTTDW